jgi:hypothetical protein
VNKKRSIVLALSILLIISFFGCSSAKNDSSVVYETSVATSASGDRTDTEKSEDEGSLQNSEFGQKMIYFGRISIETLEFEKTLNDIEEYVTSLGGFIERTSISGIGEKYETSSTRRGYAEIVYRIPVNSYSGFMENIKEYGNVVSQSSSSEDITSRYYDTEGRLKAYRIAEQRLLEILEKADAVSDMLEIERELANVRANIESMTTQIKAWDNLVNYSTVTVIVTEVKKITDTSDPDTFGKRLLLTIKKSFLGFVNFLKEMIIVIVYVLPYIIVVGVLVFLLLRGRSFLKRKK